MFRNRKEGHSSGGGAHRITARRFLPALLVMLLLIPGQSVGAAGQYVTGSTQFGNNIINGGVPIGTTAYTVDCTFPSTAQVGTNLTMTLNVHVIQLTGFIEYLIAYNIIAEVSIGTLPPIKTSVNSSATAPYLYPGATWGPNNVTIPLTAANTGLAKGESANATVSVRFEDEDWYGIPYLAYVSEPAMQGSVGTMLIQNSPTSSSGNGSSTGQGGVQAYLPYILMASGAVLVLFAVVLPRGARSSQTNQK
jgi:hypothetical protein